MKRLITSVLAATLLGQLGSAAAQTDTTFTYQGSLAAGGSPASGPHNIDVGLWDAASGGSQIGTTQSFPAHPVGEGRFTLTLDFGSEAFDNTGRWLEITVNAVTLSPRQPVTRAPYAIQTRGIVVDEENRVGIGTNAPAEELHVRGNNPTIRLQDDDDPDSFTSLEDASQSFLRFTKTNQSGPIVFDLNLKPASGTDSAKIRLFRDTNTTGAKSVDFLRGKDTTQVSASIGVDGRDSWFGLHGGNLGIGTWQPQAKLDVAGGLRVDGAGMTIKHSGNQETLLSFFTERAWSFVQEGTGSATALKLVSVVDGDKDFIVQTDGGLMYRNKSGGERVELTTNNVDAGYVTVRGPNGRFNATLGSTTPDRGALWLYDENNNVRGSFWLAPTGSGQSHLEADVKSFRMPNPQDEKTDIVFACIEGPEAAAYVRGTGRLVDGKAVVELPEYFIDVAVSQGMTVQVTPRSADSMGLAVVSQSTEHFEVRELHKGHGTYEFHWEVKSVRRGYEDFEVIEPSRHPISHTIPHPISHPISKDS